MEIQVNKIKGIILDYGGTIDTDGTHWSAVIRNAWQQAGVAADDAEFSDAYVYAEKELARTLRILPQHNFRDLLNMKIQIELQRLTETGHFSPGEIEEKAKEITEICYSSAESTIGKILPVLKKLAETYDLAVVSNYYGNLATVMKEFGIDEYFKKIIDSSEVGVRKPDPKIFELGVAALGLEPEEVLVIGDSYKNDIEPAEKLGCQILWLKGVTWSEEEQEKLHPNMISTLGDVIALLGN